MKGDVNMDLEKMWNFITSRGRNIPASFSFYCITYSGDQDTCCQLQH